MKKTISLVLALALVLTLISGLAQAEDSKWPVRELTGTVVALKPGYLITIQEQSYAGPGRGYALSGSFRPNRVVKATALLREGDYVLVDMNYATARRIVYFASRSLVSADVNEEKLEGVPAKTNRVIWPVYYGPGTDYDVVTQRSRSSYADMTDEEILELAILENWTVSKFLRALKRKDAIHWVGVGKGASVQVLFQVNDWVYVETKCSIGNARFWLPANAVE